MGSHCDFMVLLEGGRGRPTSSFRMLQMCRARARAHVQVLLRVGAEKNHVCIYISAGINHSTEKSRHKTQTGSQRGTAHPLNTQWPYVPDVHTPRPLLPPLPRPLAEKCFYYSPVNYGRDSIRVFLGIYNTAVYAVHRRCLGDVVTISNVPF